MIDAGISSSLALVQASMLVALGGLTLDSMQAGSWRRQISNFWVLMSVSV